MAIVCVLVPHYALEVALETEPQPAGAPVLVADGRERARVIDVSPAAFELGGRIGMTVLQAQAAVKEAITLVTDPVRRRERWDAILDALDAATPLVEDSSEGCAYLEMRGIPGDSEQWLRGARAALVEIAFPFAFGVGANPFVAQIAARLGRECPPGQEAVFVAPLGIHTLGLTPDILERLALLGITTLGELAALPHGPFVRRFGPDAQRWHALARGYDDRQLRPRTHRIRIERTLFGEGSAESEEAVLFALRSLVGRVVEDLNLLGKRAALMQLDLECDDGEAHGITVRIAHPTARESMLFDLVRARLEGARLSAPVIGLRLRVDRMESGGVALSLFTGGDPDPEALELALARIDAAFGEDAALRATLVEGHRDETRVRYDRFSAQALQSTVWRERPERAPVATPALHLRTFAPRSVDVTVRNGAPAFLGSPPQQILEVAGPWRTDACWWSSEHLARDEYDVLVEDGALYRLSHIGPRWFVRGCYD